MKRIICCIKAIPFFLKSGIWCPHIYKEYSKENAIIISTNSSFRVSDSYLHANCEMREKCYRVRAKPSEYQSWSNFEYTCNEDSGFEDFMPVKHFGKS